jgi:hypothetical protein
MKRIKIITGRSWSIEDAINKAIVQQYEEGYKLKKTIVLYPPHDHSDGDVNVTLIFKKKVRVKETLTFELG